MKKSSFFRQLLLVSALLLATTRRCVAEKHAFNPDAVKLNVRNNADVPLSISWINIYGNGNLVPQKEDPVEPYTQMAVDSYRGHSFVMTNYDMYPRPSELVFSQSNYDKTEMVVFTMSEFDDEVYISRNEETGELEAETVNSYTRTTDKIAEAQEICSQTCTGVEIGADGTVVSNSSGGAGTGAGGGGDNRADSSFITCVLDIMGDMYDRSAYELAHTMRLLEKASDRVRGYSCGDEIKFDVEVERTYTWSDERNKARSKVEVLMEDPTAQIARVRNFITEQECSALVQAAEEVGMTRDTVDPALRASTAELSLPPSSGAGADAIKASVFEKSSSLVSQILGVPLPREGQESFRVMRFESPHDEYLPHCDGPCAGELLGEGDRVATVLLYCQTADKGGATTFNAANVTMKAEQGSAVVVTYVNKQPFVRTDVGKTRYSECPALSGSKTVVALRLKLNPSSGADGSGGVIGSRTSAAQLGLTMVSTVNEAMKVYWLSGSTLKYLGPLPADGKFDAKTYQGHSFVLAPSAMGDLTGTTYSANAEMAVLPVTMPGEQTHIISRNDEGALEATLSPKSSSQAKGRAGGCGAAAAAGNTTGLHESVDSVCGPREDLHASSPAAEEAHRAKYLKCLEETALSLNTVKDKQVAIIRMVLEEVGDLARNLTCVDPMVTSTKNEPIREFDFVFDQDISHTNPPVEEGVESTLAEGQVGPQQVSHVKVLFEDSGARVMVLDNFVSDRECTLLTEQAKANGMSRAQVSGGTGVGNSILSETRRADAGGVKPDVKPGHVRTPLTDVYKRGYVFANNVTGYGMEHGGQEGFSVIHYGTTDEYRPHCDGDCTGTPYRAGGRVSTLVIYCEEPTLGGATSFNNIDIYVKGKRGQAAFFSYLDTKEMKTDNAKTRHSGCPIVEGTKWIATMWMRLGVTEEVGFDNWDPEGNPKNEQARRITGAADLTMTRVKTGTGAASKEEAEGSSDNIASDVGAEAEVDCQQGTVKKGGAAGGVGGRIKSLFKDILS